MPKLAELLERRAAALETMKKHEESGGSEFDAARQELDDLTPQIDRAQAIDQAERSERGSVISGDSQLNSELRSNFSIARLIAGQVSPGSVDDGFEREVQHELATRAGRNPEGVFVPMECFERRVLTSTGDGSDIVPTDHRPELFIDALTSATIVRQLGATVLNGLSGNVEIPKEAGSPAIGWAAQNQSISSGDPDFDMVTLSPKHAGARSEYSRNMIMQSSPDIEALLRKMLARDLGIAIDKAAIQGGGSNEPNGVLETAGIQTQAFDTDYILTSAEMVGKADIANVDAMRSFVSTNGVKKAAMKQKDGDGKPMGVTTQFHDEPIMFSNQVPTDLGAGNDEHGLIYGDWSELLIGVWSEIDILVNPYASTAYDKGNVQIRAMATVDAALRHPEAFVSATGVIPS